MTEVERLQHWMQSNEYNMKHLARKMNLSYLTVYTLLIQRKKLTSNFKWRFGQVFGWEEATGIFDSPDPTPEAEYA